MECFPDDYPVYIRATGNDKDENPINSVILRNRVGKMSRKISEEDNHAIRKSEQINVKTFLTRSYTHGLRDISVFIRGASLRALAKN